MLPDLKSVLVALWAPGLAGTLALAVTWLVWYYTAAPCTLENAVELMCRPGPMARYVSASVLNHGIIHASIAATIIGGPDFMLFLRERHRNNQMMDMIKTFMEEVAEQRQQEAEARREADARAAEERRQAAAERQAFLEALNRLTEAIGQNGRERQ